MSRAVWFVAEHVGGDLHEGAAELAAAARSLDAEAVAVVCADGDTVAGQAATIADRVILLQNAALAEYNADAWAQAIVAAAATDQPTAILLPHAPVGRDLAPILAARLGSGLITDCIGLEWDEGLVGSRSVYRRKLLSRERAHGGAPAVATCQRGAFTAAAGGAAPVAVDRRDVVIEPGKVRSRLLGYERAEAGEEDITEAEVIVAGGRGLGDAEKFGIVAELAAALGGAVAASRPVVDQGWLPHDRQIGSSGITVRPRLYFAIGISGAIQHIVGMRESDVIVAINKDAQAPIFEYAHYGIVADLFTVVPALLAEIRG